MKYTELIDNVYVLKEIIDVEDGFKECVGFSMEDMMMVGCGSLADLPHTLYLL